jgi:hypothetical protein
MIIFCYTIYILHITCYILLLYNIYIYIVNYIVHIYFFIYIILRGARPFSDSIYYHIMYFSVILYFMKNNIIYIYVYMCTLCTAPAQAADPRAGHPLQTSATSLT